ncbi:MAG: hypothetical protein KDJ37_13120 [Hyphomicrobiaceae bacterium]|nr:hypothetical protein [Hyphomicrobiaceae bacterium]
MSDGDWLEDEQPQRDWKKFALVVGLGLLSWVATYIGMLELIQANMGDLPLMHKAVIGFSVAMLMTMIVWLLDQMFAPIPLMTKLTYVAGYVFLTLISVGFGFGFYWKVLESRSESARSAESAIGQVQSSLHAASTRMSQLSKTLEQLNQMSIEKAELERTKGTSCPNSRPGDGPRRKLRDDDAQRFGFAAQFVGSRVASVNADLTALDGDLAKITSDDAGIVDEKTGTRNEFMRALGRKLDLTVTGFNAFRTDPQLKQVRQDLAERADKTIFPDSRGQTFTCPDPQLQQALKGVVRAIDQLPDLEKPKIAAVEGSEATIEAFRRLAATLYGLASFKMPPSADELRELQKKAVQSVEASPAVQKALAGEPVAGLSKRDYVPLSIALFVDLCLLLVSMSRPMNRLGGLVPKMRAAERGPVIQILSRFNEIHRDDEIRQNFEVFRHVVFDFHGAYYVAVPLDAPYKPSGQYVKGYSTEDIEDLQLEAHLLANLFTSFEQERIFSRVYSPLLTTRAVKRKLLRQGSKFAHADAFRVYRFRDGAWSEIILGAVMGAARRVEAEKRKRRLEDQIFASSEPTLNAANDHTQPAQVDAATVEADGLVAGARHQQAAAGGSGSRGFFADRVTRDLSRAAAPMAGVGHVATAAHPAATDAAVDPEVAAGYGPYKAGRMQEIAEERYRATLPTLRGADDILDRPRRRNRARRDETSDDVSAVKPAGEVVLFAIPGSDGADAARKEHDPVVGTPREAAAAPSPVSDPGGYDVSRNAFSAETVARPDVPPSARAGSAPSAQLPPELPRMTETYPHHAGESAGSRIGVVFRRETAEFTLPASEAMPGALLQARTLLHGAEADVARNSDNAEIDVPATTPREAEPTGAALPPPQIAQPTAPSPRFELEPEITSEDDDTDGTGYAEAPLFAEPEIDIHIDAISKRFSPITDKT